MFRAIRKSDLSDDSYFCTMVGSGNKKTSAGWYVNSPSDVILAIKKMVQEGEEH
jgi:hypothetical protein